ncbi:hypothetical protein RRG08_005679 [Elysia crispata]|uniref:Uncharacterized protein n=1 Tax=Elysia crispata TaxID=231223 RepID=A0AAE1CX00_9GAST|nr:hypothetical protein RRG08_005679 [Elysia crispata]
MNVRIDFKVCLSLFVDWADLKRLNTIIEVYRWETKSPAGNSVDMLHDGTINIPRMTPTSIAQNCRRYKAKVGYRPRSVSLEACEVRILASVGPRNRFG